MFNNNICQFINLVSDISEEEEDARQKKGACQ